MPRSVSNTVCDISGTFHVKSLLFAALLSLAAPLALAHDVWVGSDLRILFGHPDQGAEPYAGEKVIEVRTLAADGSVIPHTLTRKDDLTVILMDDRPAMAMVYFDNGHYSKTPDAGRFQPGKLAGATEVKQFVKYGKTIYAWTPSTAAPSGWGLELVPQRDPIGLVSGAALELAVHYQGKPLANAKVARYVGTEETVYTADAKGVATVPYATGDQVIYTTRHAVPGMDGVDEIGIAGALMIAPR